MKDISKKIVDELYKSYKFIEKDIDKFSEIVLVSFQKDKKYEESLTIAKRNIIDYIVRKIESKEFSKLFSDTVETLGIEKSFDLYNLIIQETEIEVDIDDIIKINSNKKYQEFYKNVESTENKLLESVLDLNNEEEEKNEVEPYLIYIADKEIHDYFLMIRDIPVLTRQEEHRLMKKYHETTDEELKKEYKSEFIWHNLKLAAKKACEKKRQYPNLKLELMDLIQEANTGLVQAFDKFDYTLGYKFSTYASWWIKKCMNRAIQNNNDTIRIPVYLYEIIGKKYNYIKNYVNEYNREPTAEEIMEYLGISQESYNSLLLAEEVRKTLSLDLEIEQEDTKLNGEVKLITFIEDKTATVENDSIDNYAREEMIEFIDEFLNPKQRKVILDRYGFNGLNETLTLEEIGKKNGYTREYARQIEEKSLNILRQHSKQIETDEHKPNGTILSKGDLKRKLEEKEMHIKIKSYNTKTKNSQFECLDCGTKFKYPPEELLELGYCPYCNEKKLIKK